MGVLLPLSGHRHSVSFEGVTFLVVPRPEHPHVLSVCGERVDDTPLHGSAGAEQQLAGLGPRTPGSAAEVGTVSSRLSEATAPILRAGWSLSGCCGHGYTGSWRQLSLPGPCAFRVSPTERGDHFSFQKELPFSKDSAAQSSSATVKVGFILGRGSPVYQKIGGRSSAKNNKFHVDGCVP